MRYHFYKFKYRFCSCALPLCLFASINILFSQNKLLPLKPGYAVVTSYGDDASSVVVDYRSVLGIIDLNNWQSQKKNANWNASIYRGVGGMAWTAEKLGPIFGIALDNDNNIYTTAFSLYARDIYNPYKYGYGGAGAVYKIDGVTEKITTFAKLPNFFDAEFNHEPALGNICFDKFNSQFFVTNFEDGKIYRLSLQGKVLSTFDPFQPDDLKPGMAPYKERIFGVGIYSNRVYFSRYTEDSQNVDEDENNQIYSIALQNTEFDKNSLKLEITLPQIAANYSNPVSDISFSQDGNRMLLSERSINSKQGGLSAHLSRCLEYVWNPNTSTWEVSNLSKFQIGVPFWIDIFGGTNSAGGSTYGMSYSNNSEVYCDSMVWCMGDALSIDGGAYIYGLQGMPATGGNLENSVLIDIDTNLTQPDKTQLGDVEIFKQCCNNNLFKLKNDTLLFGYTDTLKIPLVVDNFYQGGKNFISFVYQNYELEFFKFYDSKMMEFQDIDIQSHNNQTKEVSVRISKPELKQGDTLGYIFFIPLLHNSKTVNIIFNPEGCNSLNILPIKLTGCGLQSRENRFMEIVDSTFIKSVSVKNGKVIIEYSAPSNAESSMNIYNLLGENRLQVFKNKICDMKNNNSQILTNQLPSGFYVIELISEFGVSRKKIFIEK